MHMEYCSQHEEAMKMLRETDKRVDELEKSDARKEEQIKNLCNNLQGLTNWLKALVIAMTSTLIGFLVWSIQQGLMK